MRLAIILSLLPLLVSAAPTEPQAAQIGPAITSPFQPSSNDIEYSHSQVHSYGKRLYKETYYVDLFDKNYMWVMIEDDKNGTLALSVRWEHRPMLVSGGPSVVSAAATKASSSVKASGVSTSKPASSSAVKSSSASVAKSSSSSISKPASSSSKLVVVSASLSAGVSKASSSASSAKPVASSASASKGLVISVGLSIGAPKSSASSSASKSAVSSSVSKAAVSSSAPKSSSSASKPAASSSAPKSSSASKPAASSSAPKSSSASKPAASSSAPKSSSSSKPAASSSSSSSKAPVASASASASVSVGVSAVDQAKFLALHNAFRAKYSAGNVVWDDALANFALKTAQTCKYGHTGGPYGENIAAGVGGGYNIDKAFSSWANEDALYDFTKPGYSSATGHFTQIVWKNTGKIGCAAASCADGTIFTGYKANSTYVVCEYQAPGNVVSSDPLRTAQIFTANVGIKVL